MSDKSNSFESDLLYGHKLFDNARELKKVVTRDQWWNVQAIGTFN